MSERRYPAPLLRILSAVWLVLYIAWYWISPRLLLRLGKPEDSAWVQLFLGPTSVAGALAGLWFCLKPSYLAALGFAVLSAIHLAFGLGYFPH